MSKENSLTVKEALEQGYTLYGYEEYEYQSLSEISDLDADEFESAEAHGRTIIAAEKEPSFVSVKVEDLYDDLIDNLMDREEAHGDDTREIEHLVKTAVNWPEIADKINAALKTRPYYTLTQIKLLP
jgi:hypothetical protein